MWVILVTQLRQATCISFKCCDIEVLFKINVATLNFPFIFSHPIAALTLEFCLLTQSQVKLFCFIIMFIILPEKFAYMSEKVVSCQWVCDPFNSCKCAIAE
jgi:hypothetical protein